MIGLILCSILLMLALGELYVRWFALIGTSGWLPVLCLHGLMSVFMMAFFSGIRAQLKITLSSLWAYIPAIAILAGSLAMAFLSPALGRTEPLGLAYMIASCSVIPVVEEIIFRGGVSAALDRVYPSSWSGYFSAMVFSVAHTTPSFDRVTSLQFGLPVGPFLLGIICEYLARRSRSLVPGIAFHCACNSTVLIFNQWSPGWLNRLSIFYLG